MRKHPQKKHTHFSWIPVKDIQIPDIFSKSKKNYQSVMGFSYRAQRFTTLYYFDVDSPFQPVNSTSSLGQTTTASHFVSTIALVLANIGPLV